MKDVLVLARILFLWLVLVLLTGCGDSDSQPQATISPSGVAPAAQGTTLVQESIPALDWSAAELAPQSARSSARSSVVESSVLDQAIGQAVAAVLDSGTLPLASPQEPPPLVRFERSGYVLARESTLGIEVSTINVDELRLELLRVPQSHLGTFLGNVCSLDTTSVTGDRLLTRLDQDAALVWSGSVKIHHTPHERQSTVLPIQRVIADLPPGLFALVAADSSHHEALLASRIENFENSVGLWRRDVPLKWILNTDIGIYLARHDKGMLVNLRSLESGGPIAGAQVQVSTRNSEVVFEAQSDSEGWIQVPESVVRGRRANQAQTLLVHYGQDFSFLQLDAAPLDLSRFDVGGRMPGSRADVFLFTDRGIYRPRETVHVHALVRDSEGRDTVQAAFDLVVLRPNGTEFLREPVELTKLGSLHQRLQLPGDAPRGVWRIALMLSGETQMTGQIEIDVQDFIPERLKVQLPDRVGPLTLGSLGEVELQADYLFGAPAGGLGVEADAFARPASGGEIPLVSWDGFVFGDALNTFRIPRVQVDTTVTDAEGRATVALNTSSPRFPALEDGYAASQPLRLMVNVGVQEPGGRTSRASTSALMVSSLPTLAVRPQFQERISSTAPAVFDVRKLSPTLSEMPLDSLRWQVQRLSHRWDFDRTAQRWRSRDELERLMIAEGRVQVDAHLPNHGLVEIPAQAWGRYVLTLLDDRDQIYVRHVYRSGWSSHAGSNAPDLLELQADQKHFAPGDSINVGLDSPFDGHGTLTVWTDRPVYRRGISFASGPNVFTLDSDETWGPGVYVVIHAVRPLGRGSAESQTHSLSAERYLPARTLGVLHLQAETGRTLGLQLPADRTFSPRRIQPLEIAVPELSSQRAYAVVQAVDEGILQLTRFQTPDPAGYFFGKRRLTVDFHDYYNRLIRGDGQVGDIRSGGDRASASMGGAALEAIPTRSVVLHAGPIALDSAGRARIDLEVPDFNGRLRTMVTVWSEDAFGSAEGFWTVRGPMVAEAIFPRFLGPGDEATATLLFANTTDETLRAELEIHGEGAVGAFIPVRRVVLRAGESRRFSVPIRGIGLGVGEVHLRLAVDGQPEIRRHWPLTVFYPGALLTFQGAPQVLDPHARLDLNLDFAVGGQDDAPRRGQVIVQSRQRSLAAPLQPRHTSASVLTQLLEYRWTCSEQIASQVTPILVALTVDPEFTKQTARSVLHHQNLSDWLQERVDRILARQGSDGSIGLWREGDDLVDPELAAQLIELLALAISADLVVPEAALVSGFSWALRLINTASGSDQRRYGALARMLNAMAPHSPRSVRLARVLADESEAMDALSVSYLALALQKYGDDRRAAWLLQGLGDAVMLDHVPTLPYYGSLEAYALQLAENLYRLDLEQSAESLLVRVYAELGKRREAWLSIHEKGHLLRAQIAVALRSPTEVVWREQVYRSGLGSLVIPLNTDDFTPASEDLVLQSQSAHALTATVRIQTPPKPGVPLERSADGLVIDRMVCSLEGERYRDGLNHARVNDRFIVLLNVKTSALQSDGARQLMIMDPVPAGFQIESVLSEEDRYHQFQWLPGMARADTQEIRDVGFFAARLTDSPHRGFWSFSRSDDSLHFAYMVRATTPGQYLATQAVAEDMYDQAVRASSGGEPVRVWSIDAAGPRLNLPEPGLRCGQDG